MAEVFISYSRSNTEFVRRLHRELAKREVEAWVNWEDIPPSAEWWRDICSAIEKTDAVVFVMSPDSIASRVCSFSPRAFASRRFGLFVESTTRPSRPGCATVESSLAIQLSYMCQARFLAVATVPIFFGELIAFCSLDVKFPILACTCLVALVLPIAEHTARSCDENSTQQPESQVAVQELKESTVRACLRDLFLHEGTIMLFKADQLAFALGERHMWPYSRMSLTSYPTQVDPYSR